VILALIFQSQRDVHGGKERTKPTGQDINGDEQLKQILGKLEQIEQKRNRQGGAAKHARKPRRRKHRIF
jgi:hypothetical protein